MMLRYRNFLIVLALTLIPTFLIWLPFFLRLPKFWTIPLKTDGMATIISNYDGPLYIVVAKTLYNKVEIEKLVSFPLPAEYYPAHFPLYPLLIKSVSPFFGYPWATLIITLATSVFCMWMFYLYSGKNLWLTTVFALFPARWLVVRSVGSPEPLFIGLIIASLYFYKRGNYWLAGLIGALVAMTKSPGILLFVAYGLKFVFDFVSEKKFSLNKYPLLLIPVGLLMVFGFYYLTIGDFFAYFKTGDNIHLFFPPFQIFNYSSLWVGTFWLEEVIFVYLLALVGFIKLFKTKDISLWFVGVFLSTIFFVAHRDIVRYSLPMVPFLVLAYRDSLSTKESKLIGAIIIIPIFLFAISYITNNTMPISNWGGLL